MGSQEFLNICKSKVAEYFNSNKDKTDVTGNLTVNDVFVVWYCKTLQNFKALLSTTLSDGMYYEVTYNGDREEIYLDAYKKFENRCVKDCQSVALLEKRVHRPGARCLTNCNESSAR